MGRITKDQWADLVAVIERLDPKSLSSLMDRCQARIEKVLTAKAAKAKAAKGEQS